MNRFSSFVYIVSLYDLQNGKLLFRTAIYSGGLELARKFAKENTNTKEHDEFYKLAGIYREHAWIQRSPQGSGAPDVEIISIETHDPANMLKEFATSNHS
jgi:hypothetical protein